MTNLAKDKKGRFTKGNSGGPGNPLVGKMMRFKRALLDATSPAQAQRIFKKCAKLAEEGNLKAIQLYLAYIAGKPAHGYDPRQGLPAEAERQRTTQRYSPAEKRLLAKMLLAEADSEEQVIDAEGEEVSV
jgi:hypothetical protein